MNEEELNAFYEELGKKYPEAGVVYTSLYGRLRKKFVLLKIRKWKGSLLDLGCNIGIYSREYKGKFIGVDISKSLITKAKKLNPNAEFYVGDLKNLDFIKSNSINNILCTEVIEHIPKLDAVFKEMHRVLKKKGKFLITTPNFFKKRPRKKKNVFYEDFNIKTKNFFHTAYKPYELKNKIEEFGFKILEYGTFEKEIIYCRIIPSLIYLSINFIFPFKKIKKLNSILFNKLLFFNYKFIKFFGLINFLNSLIKEGNRTYVVAQK